MQLEKVKLLLGISGNEKDGLLATLLEDAQRKVKRHTREQELCEDSLDVAVELTILRYNSIGSEGVASEGVNGVSMSYDKDAERKLLTSLNSIARRLP